MKRTSKPRATAASRKRAYLYAHGQREQERRYMARAAGPLLLKAYREALQFMRSPAIGDAKSNDLATKLEAAIKLAEGEEGME